MSNVPESWIDADGRACAPWTCSAEPIYVKLDGYRTRVYVINSGNLVVGYAFAGSVYYSRPDGEPNARLIAAAPELLEVARILAAAKADWFDVVHYVNDRGDSAPASISLAIEKARAAIAKAGAAS